MVYTVQQIKQGTGFDRKARFLDAKDAKELRAALAELVAIAHIYSDINAGERGQNAMAFARGALRKTDGIEN